MLTYPNHVGFTRERFLSGTFSLAITLSSVYPSTAGHIRNGIAKIPRVTIHGQRDIGYLEKEWEAMYQGYTAAGEFHT